MVLTAFRLVAELRAARRGFCIKHSYKYEWKNTAHTLYGNWLLHLCKNRSLDVVKPKVWNTSIAILDKTILLTKKI